ncbi:MAG: helicase HerA-like domain-containing protein [Alphaproteobacteria bacterium]
MGDKIFIGGTEAGNTVELDIEYINRHGLIAGATGTGKTVTLQTLAESLSDYGIPVFVSDVKGDLTGISQPGEMKPFLEERAKKIGYEPYGMMGFPSILWDIDGQLGHPVRSSISEMGPLMLTRILELSEAQEGILYAAFAIADDQGMLMLNLDDLSAMLNFMVENRKDLAFEYGNITTASVGTIQRKLMALKQEGAKQFFTEPALELNDLMRTDASGRGAINILAAENLMTRPKIYGTFLLYLLSELFEELPEAGDVDKPKLVLFFDEAHLIFDDISNALLDKIEQVVRLIRSKGVGVFFVTQNPKDLPDSVSAQLGCRIQHALRAYTPNEQKVIRAAADTFRANPEFDTLEVITQMGVGEALISTLEKKGVPSVVQRTLIRPPHSRMGPITDAERRHLIAISPIGTKYDTEEDPRSAYEMLQERAEKKVADAELAQREKEREFQYERERRSSTSYRTTRSSNRQTMAEAAMKSAVRAASSKIGREIARGILGSIMRGR